MAYFVVHRSLPGIDQDQLASAGLRAKSCCSEMTHEGKEVRWIRSYFLPKTEQTQCYFEAPNVELVREANERAQIPFQEIHEAEEMSPEMV